MFQPEATPSGPSSLAQAQQPSPASPTFSHAPHMKPSCTAHVSFSLTRFVSLPPACMHACSSPSSPLTRCPHTKISCTTSIAWIICMWEQGRNGTVFPRMLQFAFEEVVRLMAMEESSILLLPFLNLMKRPQWCLLKYLFVLESHAAANIATPEWLKVAGDAAIRRASIKYPPMVSHFWLLYDLALELCSRVPTSTSAKPKSPRLMDKKKRRRNLG